MGNATGIVPVADTVAQPIPLSNNVDKIINSLFRPDEKRLQLWPERVVREGITAAGKVASGEVPQWAVDPATGDVHTSPQMVEKAQEVSALAGSGGLASGGGSLNATPSLRPALKHKEKLYKGKPGQEHQDIIPDTLYNDFQKKAMAGQDLAEYNFGFVNDKGHFLSREDALKYGIDNGLIDPQAGKYGALTSTLFSDSSKPGVAIESLKNFPKSESLAIPPAPTLDVMKKLSRVENVNLDNVKSTNKLDWDKFNKGEHPEELIKGYGDKPVAVKKENGEYLLYDGHHRSALARNSGSPQMEMYVIDAKNYAPEFAGKKSVKDNIDTDTLLKELGYNLKPVEYNPFELKS